ncbi:MAG: flippase activity-associated protein Agl23 [Phycisphaerae bacterium]
MNAPHRAIGDSPRDGPSRRWLLALLMITAFAAWLRFPALDVRPMQGDEAVHAIKLDELLRTGRYVYDPHEYHGPTLYYFTLPICWATGVRSIADIDERTLRIVPAIFGVGLILLLPLVADGLGRGATMWAAALIATSHAFVFYGRYYIQETLLVFFTFAAIACWWRFLRSERLGWAIAAGASVGLAHATKETIIIAAGCAVAACVLNSQVLRGWQREVPIPAGAPNADTLSTESDEILSTLLGMRRHAAIRIGAGVVFQAAGVVSICMFSAFFTHWRGVLDSVLTYATYLGRADGDGIHNHPWWFYLQRIAYTHFAAGPVWSEAVILVAALLGFVVAATPRTSPQRNDGDPRFVQFVAAYTLLLTLAYCLIPYKTPWCALGFLHGMTLLGGVGIAWLAGSQVASVRFIAVAACFALAIGQLASQAATGSTRFASDNRNPYVYAHPIRSVVELGTFVERVAAAQADGRRTLVHVYMHDAWPLPWYLRRLERVGYWEQPQTNIDAPIVIADESLAPRLDSQLGEQYAAYRYGIRPDTRVIVYVRRDAKQRFDRSQSHDPQPHAEAQP